jgi:dTDP-4-dehydrorhamnose 3,5-epimerase
MEMLEGRIIADDRGTVRFINDFDFANVRRFYQVENHRSGYIRAWHAHVQECKYVYVVTGAALIGVVDFTDENAVPEKFVLSAEIPKVLWIPYGNANGFMSLRENTRIIFYSTSTLEESMEDDIRFPHDKWDIWSLEDYR